MKIIFIYIFIKLIIFIYSEKENNFKKDYILRQITIKEKVQKISNLVNIYNPFNIVSYISSITNKNGDLFIAINFGENHYERIIYSIKSDGTNYFNDTDNKPYKIFISKTNDYNYYPMLSFLIINDIEYLITFSQGLIFETFDFLKNKVYTQGLFETIKYNSNVYKNAFFSLNYFNNTNYAFSAYVDKRERIFLMHKLYYRHANISYRKIIANQSEVCEGTQNSPVTCFEVTNLVECLYLDKFRTYEVAIFQISNYEEILKENIETHMVRFDFLFSKCIHIKEYIGAFIYFKDNNSFPVIKFKRLNIISEGELNSTYLLDDYRESIEINIDNKFELGNNYIYNDIIKIDEKNLFYISTKNESDILIIIMIKLSDKSQNILINYYKIELKEKYNIRIYKDISIFKYNGLLGIGMTHYNFDLSNNKTYASYFIIGESYINNITLSNNIIFNEGFKIEDYINIKNNIFGYILSEFKILNILDEEKMGFYLYSNELKKKIERNELIKGNDTINFKIISEIGIKLNNYTFEYEGIISEPDYNKLILLSDSYEEYFNDNSTFDLFYEPKIFSIKQASFNLNINYCYKTCESCKYLGDDNIHHCDTCSNEYPFLYKIPNSTLNHSNNCIKPCNENYILNEYNICVPINNNNIIKLLGFSNYTKLVNNIKEMSDNGTIIKNFSNLTIYSYEIGEKKEQYYKNNNLIYIDFINSNVKDEIIKNLDLDKETKIYILLVESNCEHQNPLTKDLDFILLFENGTEVYINEDILVNVSAPIIDLESAHYEYAVYFDKLGYDIYDKNSSFYNDICISVYYKENDITIEDRKKEIFPNNMTIVNPNCVYKMADLKNKRLICEYNIAEVFESRKTKNYKVTDNYFEIQKENFFYYLLDFINYKILTCSYIIFDSESYKNNLAVIFCSITSFLIILFIIIFFIHGLPKFKIMIYNEIPTTKKLLSLFKKNYNFLNKYNRRKKRNKTGINNPIKRKRNFNFNLPSDIFFEKGSSNNTSSQSKTNINIKTPKDILTIRKGIIGNINNKYERHKKKSKTDINNDLKIGKRIKKVHFTNKIKNYLLNEENVDKSDIKKEYDDMPFTKALRTDKRNVIQIFESKIIDKLDLIYIFMSKKFNIKELPLSKYILFILIDVMMTALLYSDSVVSHKFHNNGKLDFIVTITLTISSNVLSLLIEYYISLLVRQEEIFEQIKEIKQKYVYIEACKKFYKLIIIQTIVFLFFSLVFIGFCFYYLFIFCNIYSKSQISLLMTYLITFSEGILANIAIAIIISVTRKSGIKFKNKYLYNTSKYIDQNF